MNKVGKEYALRNDIEWDQVKKLLKKGQLKYDDKKSIELNMGYIEHKKRVPTIGSNGILLSNFATELQYKITSMRKHDGKYYSSLIMSHDELKRMWEYKDEIFTSTNNVTEDMEETTLVPYKNKNNDNVVIETKTKTQDKPRKISQDCVNSKG